MTRASVHIFLTLLYPLFVALTSNVARTGAQHLKRHVHLNEDLCNAWNWHACDNQGLTTIKHSIDSIARLPYKEQGK
jgi:hypothetical protein